MRRFELSACNPPTIAPPPTIQNMVHPRNASSETNLFAPVAGGGDAVSSPEVASIFAPAWVSVAKGVARKISELQLQTQLYVPWTGGTRNHSCGLCVDSRTWKTKVWMIEYVKEFSPELQIQFLRNGISLDQRKVPLLDPRSGQNISTGISKARHS